MARPLAVAVLALALLLLATGAASSLEGPALIRVTQRTISEGEAAGQMLQTSFIRDRKGARIGWSVILCTDLGSGEALGGGTSFCQATFSFPKGRIQVAGTRKTRLSYVLAVVGGTGLYSNSAGTLLVRTSTLAGARVELLLFGLET